MPYLWDNKRIQLSRRSSAPRYSSSIKSTELSKTTSNDTGRHAGLSSEEVDCFRSMRGTSIQTASSLESAMSADLSELDERLDTIRRAGEREKKVFDKSGQAYSILVTHDEVRVCHVDDKGEYHYRHLPTVTGPSANSRAVSGVTTRRTSNNASDAKKPSPAELKKSGRWNLQRMYKTEQQKPKTRRQIVKAMDGRTLVDATPDTVTVYHRGGVWRCHRFAGKIWDSDYTTHITARIPRPWQKLRHRHRSASADDADSEESDKENVDAPELLLCSNTPGEKDGPPPRAYKSFYHDL